MRASMRLALGGHQTLEALLVSMDRLCPLCWGGFEGGPLSGIDKISGHIGWPIQAGITSINSAA